MGRNGGPVKEAGVEWRACQRVGRCGRCVVALWRNRIFLGCAPKSACFEVFEISSQIRDLLLHNRVQYSGCRCTSIT